MSAPRDTPKFAARRWIAAAGYAALRDEGEAGVAKADRLEKDADRKKEDRKRKKAQVGGLVEKLALLTEEGVALLGRLGCGAEKLGVGDDGPGELIDADSFPKDAAELQKLIDDEAGALVIKKKRQAINASHGCGLAQGRTRGLRHGHSHRLFA